MVVDERLIVGFLLVAVGIGIFTYRLISRLKRRLSPSSLTMQGAWDYWTKNENRLSDEDRQIVELAREKLSESTIERIHKELLELEKKSNQAEDPLVPLRAAIMDAVDTSLLNKALTDLDDEARKKVQGKLGDLYTDEIFSWGYLTNSFLRRVLRWYSSLKYGDAAENDWFAFYREIADQRARSIVEMILRCEADETGTDGIHALMRRADEEGAMDQVRQRLLQAPKKTPIRKVAGAGIKGNLDDWTW
jgi:hypothetical protein